MSTVVMLNRDSELQFYEMANFEPYCQLKKLESIPLKLVCWYMCLFLFIIAHILVQNCFILGMILRRNRSQ